MQDLADEQNSKLQTHFEKMGMQLKEKDKRIGELLRYEHGAKKSLEEKQKYTQQIEQSLKSLQKRFDVVQHENDQLLQGALVARDMIQSLVAQNEASKLQYDDLSSSFASEQEEKKELQTELKALYKQFETLKKHVELHKEKFHSQIQTTEKVQQSLLRTEQKNESLQVDFTRCKEEIGVIKQHLSKGMRDAKDLENRFCEAVTEKVDILKSMRQVQREFDKQHQDLINTKEKLRANSERTKFELFDLEQRLSGSNQRCDALEIQLNALQKNMEDLLENRDQLHIANSLLENEKEVLVAEKGRLEKQLEENALQIKQVSQRLEKVTQEKDTLEIQQEHLLEEISLQKALNEEKDFQLEEARQHFAKKMREVAQMNDAIEDLVRQAGEQEVIQKHLKEVNNLLDCDVQRGEEEKKELSEKIAVLEVEIIRWQQDWLTENQQRQFAEERNAELRKIEQCHAQLQSLLSGVGGVLVPPTIEDKPLLNKNGHQSHTPLQFGILPELSNSDDNESAVKPYSNLFDLPQVQSRSKQNLFD